MSAPGRAFMDLQAELLPMLASLLPRAYRVVGSDRAEYPGCVRLILESDDIAPNVAGIQMVMVIEDVGSRRTIVMKPVPRTPTAGERIARLEAEFGS